jgi:hypothetical protein
MKWIPSPKQFKYILIALTALIFISTLVYTNYLVKEVAKHEKEKAELWVKTIEKKIGTGAQGRLFIPIYPKRGD